MNFARSLQCELGKNEHNEEEWGQETIDSTSVNLELGLKWWKIRFESFSDEMWIVECDCNAGDGAPSSSPPWPAAVSAELRALSLLGQLFPSWPCLKLQVPFSSIETVGQHPSSIMIGKVWISNAQTKSHAKCQRLGTLCRIGHSQSGLALLHFLMYGARSPSSLASSIDS
jgi:hypothetical protein